MYTSSFLIESLDFPFDQSDFPVGVEDASSLYLLHQMTIHTVPPIIIMTNKMVNIAAPALSPAVIALNTGVESVFDPAPAFGSLVELPPVVAVSGVWALVINWVPRTLRADIYIKFN